MQNMNDGVDCDVLAAVQRSPTTNTHRISRTSAVAQTQALTNFHHDDFYPYHLQTVQHLFFFLIGIVRGGVQLGPLSTAATHRPIVPAPDDYDDGKIGGMMIGRGNRSTR
jgi:hypothetical protein